jgi:hypothetical protein
MVLRVANSATYTVALSDAPSIFSCALSQTCKRRRIDFMLRSRAADALTTAWPAWQFNVKKPS